MGATDRRGLKTKRTIPYMNKKRKGKTNLKPAEAITLSPEEIETENWIQDTDNPQVSEFRRQFRTKTKQAAMMAALIKTMGIVTQACELAGVGRQTHYDWLENDPEYGKALEAAHNRKKDVMEHALMKLITDGNPQAIVFGNETINKDRGYIKKQEIVNSFSGTQNIKIVIPDNDTSDEPQKQETPNP